MPQSAGSTLIPNGFSEQKFQVGSGQYLCQIKVGSVARDDEHVVLPNKSDAGRKCEALL